VDGEVRKGVRKGPAESRGAVRLGSNFLAGTDRGLGDTWKGPKARVGDEVGPWRA